MSDTSSKELLRRLSEAPGPPGAEDAVRRIVVEQLRDVGSIRHDRLGSVICEVAGPTDGPRVVLDSHLDEVGFMVQSISGEGRLAFVPLGGWWGHVLLGQRVNVLTEAGSVPGVIGCTPPHFLGPDQKSKVLELEQMYIDLGASTADEIAALGIRVGDPIVPCSEFREMPIEGVFSGKALDNRLGVALMCEVLAELKRGEQPNTVIGVGAVQEEVGVRGAATACEISRPDVAVVLECTPADDLPGQTPRQGVLGGGPQIRIFDPTAISNRRLVRLAQETAEEAGVAVQLAVRRGGGTDAKAIHGWGRGVPTVVLGVPARYIHSHVGLMQFRDYVATRKLVLALVRRLDASAVEGLTRFDESAG
ncbi:MAG: M42 family metallopeptidase [bacterium]|nr:M42 family metallopeptidase [bacterium]